MNDDTNTTNNPITKSTQTKRLSNLERRLTDTEHSIKHIFLSLIKQQARLDTFEKFLYDNIEAIKCVKADKEDVEEKLKEKADRNVCDNKTEFHQFEHTRKDLSVGLTITLEKIENMFRQLIDVRHKIEEFELFRLGCENQGGQGCSDARCKLLEKFESLKKIKTNLDEGEKVCSKKLEVDDDLMKKKLRNCGGGGPHTKTNPMERIFKKYNFYNDHPDAEPCASCLDEHTFKVGTDGVLYRIQKIKCDCNESSEKKISPETGKEK